jgi:hypothetical protein
LPRRKKPAGRYFNPIEENAEYILIRGGIYKFSVTGETVQAPDLYFAKFPVTNKLYKIFLDSLPKQKQDEYRSNYASDKRFNGDDQPVVGVTWYSAMAFCEWLTEQSAEGKAKKWYFDCRQRLNGNGRRPAAKENIRGRTIRRLMTHARIAWRIILFRC